MLARFTLSDVMSCYTVASASSATKEPRASHDDLDCAGLSNDIFEYLADEEPDLERFEAGLGKCYLHPTFSSVDSTKGSQRTLSYIKDSSWIYYTEVFERIFTKSVQDKEVLAAIQVGLLFSILTSLCQVEGYALRFHFFPRVEWASPKLFRSGPSSSTKNRN